MPLWMSQSIHPAGLKVESTPNRVRATLRHPAYSFAPLLMSALRSWQS